MVSIEDIRDALADVRDDAAPFAARRHHAAVAMVLAGSDGALSLCFIRRADRPGDPWSGHMAFPGGRADPEDRTAEDVARRETEEEVGLRLGSRQLVAPLPELPVMLGGRATGMRLSPFVFHVGAKRPPLHPNGEVAEAMWIPLNHLFDPTHHITIDSPRGGMNVQLPAISYGEHIVWGLTYRVLTDFAERLGRPLPRMDWPRD